jgi:hypothetical protein
MSDRLDYVRLEKDTWVKEKGGEGVRTKALCLCIFNPGATVHKAFNRP